MKELTIRKGEIVEVCIDSLVYLLERINSSLLTQRHPYLKYRLLHYILPFRSWMIAGIGGNAETSMAILGSSHILFSNNMNQ